MAAVLKISSDPSEVRAAFGILLDEARKANKALGDLDQRRSRDHSRTLTEEQKAAVRSAREEVEAKRKADRDKERIERDAQRRSDRLEREAQRARDRESRDKVRRAERDAKELERIDRQRHERERRDEARATREQQREYSKRQQSYERWQRDQFRSQQQAQVASQRARDRFGSQVGGFTGRAIGGAIQIGSQLHGQIQDARMRRAQSAHNMNLALYQAGADATTAAPLRQRVYDFARQNRMDSGELAEALNAAQTEFSVLGNSRSSQADRSANLEQALSNALLARNTGQNPGEVMRLAGMLQNSGVTGTAQRNTLLALTGMAQRGAIELGSVTRTAMAPMQARVGQALAGLGPGATDAQKSRATQQAVLQTFAEMEVGRGLGYTPRNLGNIMSAMGSSLQSNVTQSKMLTNIRSASGLSAERRQQIESDLFENGQLKQQFRSGFGLAQGLMRAFRGDSVAMQNVFAGGGHGNPQSLQANWRRVMAAFMGEGNEDVAKMMSGAGTDFTEADVDRGAGIFGGEDLSNLIANQEKETEALADNTGALRQLSDNLARFMAEHPVGGAIGGAIAGGLATSVGTKAAGSLAGLGMRGLGAAGGAIGKTAAGQAITRIGAAGGAAGAAGSVAAGAAALLGGMAIGDIGWRLAGGNKGLGEGNSFSVFNTQTLREFGRGVAEWFTTNPPTVRISPQDAAIAAARDSRSPAERNGSQ